MSLKDRAKATMDSGYRGFRVDASIDGAIPDGVFNTHERVRLVAQAYHSSDFLDVGRTYDCLGSAVVGAAPVSQIRSDIARFGEQVLAPDDCCDLFEQTCVQ